MQAGQEDIYSADTPGLPTPRSSPAGRRRLLPERFSCFLLTLQVHKFLAGTALITVVNIYQYCRERRNMLLHSSHPHPLPHLTCSGPQVSVGVAKVLCEDGYGGKGGVV